MEEAERSEGGKRESVRWVPKVMQNAMVEGFGVELLARGTDIGINVVGAS